METLVKILHVIVCIFLMLTVLLQAGKGGGMGAAFGGGSSMGTVFGGSGAGNFLRRLTVGAAVIFMITSMTLAWMSTPTTDPLEKYWAQQHKAAMDREKARDQALEDDKKSTTTDEDKPEGAGVGPDEMIDTPEGEGGEGATDDLVDTPEGQTSDAVDLPEVEDEIAPVDPKKDTLKPKAKPPAPPPAAPVAPPPPASGTTTPP